MNDLAALLGDLEQLYQDNVKEIEAPRGAGAPPAIQRTQSHSAGVSMPSPRSHRSSIQLPPRPTNNPYAQYPQPQQHHRQMQMHLQQMELVRREDEERERERLIQLQHHLIEEQNRQIAELRMQRLQQQQQTPLPPPAPNDDLDDILDDLNQLIAAETKTLPDSILADLNNLTLRGPPDMPPPQPTYHRTQRPASTYIPRGAVPAAAGGAPASASVYLPQGVPTTHSSAPFHTVAKISSNPRTARASAQELQQQIAARPQQQQQQQAPQHQVVQQQQQQAMLSSPLTSRINTTNAGSGIPLFSARRPTLSSARTRPALPALYTSVKDEQYDVPPVKVPLVPRVVREGEGKPLSLTMSLVDGSTKKIVVSDDFTIQDVLIAYASKIGLWQVDFFHLAESRPGKSDRWLHPAIKTGRYGIQESSKLVMKIKYFKRPKYLVDPIALRLFYLQLQANVVSGAYPCAERLAIRLAAHQLQMQEGDHQPQRHKPGWFGGADNLQKYVPTEVVLKYPVDYIEERIFRLHAKLVGKNNQEELAREYVELASAIPTFGINLYNVFDGEYDKGGVKRRLGIGEDGIMLTRRAEKNVYDFYPWTKMGGWLKAGDTLFQIKVAGQPILVFQAPAECVFDIVELLTGYYLMAFHSDPSVPDLPIPYEPDCLPHPRLYLPCKPRNLQNVFTKSCLEVLKDTYETACKEYTVRPIEALLLQVDETLDQINAVLKRIVLQRCDLGEYQFRALLRGLEAAADHALHGSNNSNLLIEEIDLSCNQNALTSRHAQFVAQLVGQCPVLRILNLNDNRLGTQGAAELAVALGSNLTLHELHIASNQILDKGMALLVKALKGNQGLHTFNFADNGLTADACKLLGDMLEKNPHVTNLSLGVNKFGDNGINHLYHGIKFNTTLLRLNLCRTEFSPKAGKHLMRILTEKPNIVCVKLGNNDIGQTGGQMLGAYLTAGSRLTVLDLTSTNIGSKSLRAIARGLKENKSVTTLKLSGNEFGKKGAMALAESLESNRTLLRLAIAQCAFPKVALLALVHVLKSARNTTLQQINLSHNPMPLEVAKAVGDMLAYNTSLRVLNLAGCISSDGAKEITSGIGVNRGLHKLNLSGCRMSKAVWTSLADAVLQNRTLERLVCKETACDTRLFEEVLNHWDMRKHLLALKVLNLASNRIDGSQLQERIRHYPMRIILD